jgi:hypothetical protein
VPYCCPVCKNKITKADHDIKCNQLAGIHDKYHDIIVQAIINKIKAKHRPKHCPTLRQLEGDDNNRRPDIYTETDNQTFDFTISNNM